MLDSSNYSHAWDDRQQTLTHSNTKNSKPHLLPSYPSCGIAAYMPLVWNLNTEWHLLILANLVSECIAYEV